jgi:hypothetical protein
MHENYHARWDKPGGASEAFLWRLEIPLILNGLPIGRLSVSAERDHQSLIDTLQVLIKIIELAELRAMEEAADPPSIRVASPRPVKPVGAEPAVAARV